MNLASFIIWPVVIFLVGILVSLMIREKADKIACLATRIKEWIKSK